MAAPVNTFSKKQRLKSHKKLEQLFAEGNKFHAGAVKLLFLAEPGAPGVTCGVGASRRLFKKAVDRNRVKRLLREAFRLQQHDLNDLAERRQTALFLFILYTGKEMPGYENIYREVGLALQKLLNSKFTSHPSPGDEGVGG